MWPPPTEFRVVCEHGAMAVEQFPVEATHIMMFARAIGDPNPAYTGQDAIAPPTFVQASAQFDPDYPLRPKLGEPWFGSAKEPTGVRRADPAAPEDGDDNTRPKGGGNGGTLHAEQRYEYHRPLRAGDMLIATVREGRRWEKEGKRSGKLLFVETITEYRDAATGELVVTATGVGVRTERPVGS
jgi:hypothetical protein